MNHHLLWTGVQSFGFSVVLTPIIRDIFRSFKVVDQPDDPRKVHVHPIPRVGGIAIAIAYVLAFYLVRLNGSNALDRELSVLSRVLPAALLVFATGLVDDFWGLKPWQKMLGLLAAAGLAISAGVRITDLAGSPIPTVWSVLLTIGWLLLCSNAFNLVDGLDGLAAGVGVFATLTMFIAAVLQGNEPLAFATLPLAGCLLGFLCFNFNPATVFLGDCGSLLIGFLLGCFGVIWTQKSITLLGMTAPLMAMSVPLLDVLLCIIRRWLRDQPIFSADRGHIHHRLLDRGLSPRQAVFLLYGLCGLAATFSLIQSFVKNFYTAGLVVLLFAAVAWVGIHNLHYAEFVLAGRLLRKGKFQRSSVSANLKLNSFEKSIAKAQTLDECWEAVLNAQETFGFAAIRMQVGDLIYESWGPEVSGPDYWTVKVPVTDGSYVELARQLHSPVLPMVVVPFIDRLASALSSQLQEPSVAVSVTKAPILMQTSH